MTPNDVRDSHVEPAALGPTSDSLNSTAEYLVVSVESRKGGVGKTTTAFCLADLLVRQFGYVVLLVDADLAGTDAGVAADCQLWRQLTNVLRADGGEPANALSLFESKFLSGQGVPEMRFRSDRGSPAHSECLELERARVNVLGSSIYHRTQKGDRDYVVEPEFLFDSLHGFWFTEFLEQLCNRFASAAREIPTVTSRVAIVIDNAPGFVGAAPAVQEWITNLGPQRGKTLFVSSLDAQDLIAVGEAIERLRDLYRDKVAAAELHRAIVERSVAQTSQERLPPSGRQLGYLLEIAQQAKLDSQMADAAHSLGGWYSARGLDGAETLLGQLGYAVGMLVNKVPIGLFSSEVSYDLRPVLRALGVAGDRELPIGGLEAWIQRTRRSSGRIPAMLDLLAPGKGGAETRMVATDAALEGQFLNLYRRGTSTIGSLCLAKLQQKQTEILERPMPSWGRGLSTPSLVRAASQCQDDLESTAQALAETLPSAGGYLLRSWLPGGQLGDLGMLLSDHVQAITVPRPGAFEAPRRACRRGVLAMLTDPDSGALLEPHPEAIRFLVETAFAALAVARRVPIPGESKRLTRILAGVAAMQLGGARKTGGAVRRTAVPSLFSPADYAAAGRRGAVSNLAWKLLRSSDESLGLSKREFWDLNAMFCQTQARLLDLGPDTSFLVGYLVAMAARAADELQPPLGEEGLVEAVLRKELRHDAALMQLAKLRSTGTHIAQLSHVLKGILADWAVGDGQS